MESWMNLRSIEIFVVAIEDKSMSRAAERLNLTQSAVSQAISNLEKGIGSRLIDRSVRPLKTTFAGATFYKRASELLDRARALEQAVGFELNERLPFLRIGMVDSFAATAGPHLVEELDNIAVHWSVASGHDDTNIRALLERRVDFMITPDGSYKGLDLIALLIFTEPFLIMTPRSQGVGAINLTDLSAEMPFVRYTPRSFIGRQVNAYLQQQELTLRQPYELDTSDAVMAMVSARIGWTITTPLVALKSRPSADEVQCHPLPDEPIKRTLWLMARPGDSVELAGRLAAAARAAIVQRCLPNILLLAPWMREQWPDLGDAA